MKQRQVHVRQAGSARHRRSLTGVLAMFGILVGTVVAIVGGTSVAPAGATNTVSLFATSPGCGTGWNNYNIPMGAVSARVILTGGGGGGGGTESGENITGSGGAGATVDTTLTGLTGGAAISLTIGCGGGGGKNSAAGGTGGTSGYGPGGGSNGSGNTGGGGGGATALCLGTSGCTTPLVVASGGGGGGAMWRWGCFIDCPKPTGGDGGEAGNGSANGGDGVNGSSSGADAAGGAGATGSDAGNSGVASGCSSGGGSNGSSHTGGNGGGNGGSCSSGGGGGGGYYGGGGGGGSDNIGSEAGGGGGAGSSYTTSATVTYTRDTTKSTASKSTSVGTSQTNPGRGGGRVNGTSKGYQGTAGIASITFTLAATQSTWNSMGTATTNTVFPTQPQVTVKDVNNNVVPNESLTISQASGPTANALSCTTATATSNASGVATFAGCKVNGKAGTYTFKVTTASTSPASDLTGTGTINIVSPTATTVSCTSPFPWNGVSTCSVSVTDTSADKVTPTAGTVVTLASVGDGTGSFTTCTLNASAQCSSNFSANKQDTYSITATFPATSLHLTSTSAATTTSMRSRLTTTSVACSPNSVVVNTNTTCTATVTDVFTGTKVAPLGTVTFGQSGGGTFSGGGTCSLTGISGAVSQCNVQFQSTTAGNKTVSASYAGATSGAGSLQGYKHGSSASTTPAAVTVTGTSIPTRHATTTGVSCTSTTVAVGDGTTCTVTVTDVFAYGPTLTPTGTVTWGYSGGGAFSPSNTCTLVEVTPGVSSSCSVTFTPAAPAGNKTVNAFYNGNSTFYTSGSGSLLIVAT